jgi:uncharacterized membrane protein
MLSIPIILFIIIYLNKGKISVFYYRMWYKFNKNRFILSSKNNHDELFNGIVIGIIVLVLIFSFGIYVLNTTAKEDFSEMLLLNSEGSIGNYPQHILVGQNSSVYVLIVNHEGKPELYEIKAILIGNTNNSTVEDTFAIIKNNGQLKIPVSFMVNSSGEYKLKILLYYYDLDSDTFVYANIFTQLLVNAT